MKSLYKLAIFSIFAFTGCFVDPDTREATISMPAAVAPVSVPAELNLDATKSTSGASIQTECFYTWICQVCPGVQRRRDVLWEECSDGSRTVVDQTACGERGCN
jgi:hypothetical protein